jgi:transposase
MGNERWHGRRGIDDGIRRQYQGAGFAWSQAPECRACDQNTAWRTPPRVKGRCTPGLTPGPLTRQTLSSTWTRSRHQALKCLSWKIMEIFTGKPEGVMKLTPVGIDIAKNVFQVHHIDEETGEIVNKPIKRAKFLEYFVNRAPCLIGMEACGGAHHWARQLTRMGHQVKLMPGEYVKAFNIRNKKDPADARAIWLAVQQPSKPVAIKTEMQQAMLALHRTREQLVKFRTMQINALRGLLTEYGEVMAKGRAPLDRAMPDVLARVADRLPAALIDTLREQWNGLTGLDEQIATIERRMREWKKEDQEVKAISEIPGVGLLTATAAVATIGDAKAFRSGREFAACIGLVPKQTGSGGKVKLHGISKRGDTYLRTLLIHGARSVITNAKQPDPWIEQMKKRRPPNVVVVALANKMARTIWAVLAHDRPYQRGYVSTKPA